MILVVGSMNMDHCYRVAEMPAVGETVLANEVVLNPGGKGANQATAAAKLGGDVVMLGCVGADAPGDALVGALAGAGVDTVHIRRLPEQRTSSAFICISERGENFIVVDSAANWQLTPAYLHENRELFERADCCILQLEVPLETVLAAAALCRENGVKILLNPSPMQPLPAELLRGVDYLIPNEHEMAALLQKPLATVTEADYAAFAAQWEVENLIVTLGGDGCVLVAGGECRHFPASAHRPLDTTGAGDTFLGALAAALMRGLPAPRAIPFATQASGIAVTRFGAQQSMPTLQEMEEYP